MQNPIRNSALALVTGTLAALLIAGTALAEDMKVKLGGDQEVPPVQTQASGDATITVHDDKSVSGSVKTTGIAATAAHIHEAAAGKNGPVVIPLEKKGDSEFDVPAGAKLSEAQYKALKAGHLYINVHSDAHKGGEIRGQLK